MLLVYNGVMMDKGFHNELMIEELLVNWFMRVSLREC